MPYGRPGHRSRFVPDIEHPGSIIASFGHNSENSTSYLSVTHIIPTTQRAQRLGTSIHPEQECAPRSTEPPAHHPAPTAGASCSRRVSPKHSRPRAPPNLVGHRAWRPSVFASQPGHCDAEMFLPRLNPVFPTDPPQLAGKRIITASCRCQLSREASAAAAFDALGADNNPQKPSSRHALSPTGW